MADWFFSKDGQQQGPVSAADLKQMAASGQLRPDDLVWKEGMAQWAKASQLKGVFGAAAEAPILAAPNLPLQGQYAAPSPAMQQYPAAGQVIMQPTGGTSGMAVASLVCGILFCVPFCSLLAIIFGIVGIVQTSEGRRRGRGLAIAGLCTGVVGILLSVAILLPALNRARHQAQQVKSAFNEKQIGLAIIMYANANQGQYPPDLVTLAKAQSLIPSVFVDPATSDTPAASIDALESGGHNSYIYLGAGLTNPPSTAVLLYEKPNPHTIGANVLFGDGHVEFVNNGRLPGVLIAGKN